MGKGISARKGGGYPFTGFMAWGTALEEVGKSTRPRSVDPDHPVPLGWNG